jgi:hypothetical protein
MNTAQQIESTITDKNQHDLVKGSFSPEDALEIINHLIAEKINFHEMRSFSSKIRFGEVDQNSEERIIELKKSRAAFTSIITKAREQGKTLKIESTISVEVL